MCSSDLTLETRARRVVESMALALQGSLLVRHGDAAVADARAAVGPDRLVGLSTHSPEQVEISIYRLMAKLPTIAAFSYKKKAGRREYVRVSLRRAPDGSLEAQKFPREGAGLLSSLVDTDGLVELGEDITAVEPGASVGYLGYASLM